MRQLAEEGHISPRQTTPGAGTQSSTSNVRMLGTNKITPVCLPLLSESKQLLWVYSNQLDLPADSVADLDKAFDMFPYLTHKQNTDLAQRCSLHPDQVKVWFMAQRIQYGISWDHKDIRYMQNKFRSKTKDAEEKREVQNEMDEEMQEKKSKKQNQKGEEEGTTMAQKVTANENLERKTKQKQSVMKEKQRQAEEDNTNTQNKRKLGSKIDKERKKRVKHNNDEGDTEVDIKMDKSVNVGQAFTESEGAFLNRKKKTYINQTNTVSKIPSEPDFPLSTSSFLKPPIQTLNTVPLTENQTAEAPSTIPVNVSFEGKHEALAGLQEDLHIEASDSEIMVTDIGKLKELTSINNGLVPADGPPTLIKQDADRRVAPNQVRNKTKTQLAMLKVAFLHCQYPDRDQYSWIAELAEISRTVLIQWYGDMRYSIKKAKPRWMTEEQYKEALNNIKYHQYKSKLKKSTERPGHTALVKILEVAKSSIEKEASDVKTE